MKRRATSVAIKWLPRWLGIPPNTLLGYGKPFESQGTFLNKTVYNMKKTNKVAKIILSFNIILQEFVQK